MPVRLSTTYFDGIGECIAFTANRADKPFTDIIENSDSEVFLTIMNYSLYDEIKSDILNWDYWIPNSDYFSVKGLADGVTRIIHLDKKYF